LTGALSKAWWLLALCGILDAMHASINLLMMNLPLIFRELGSPENAVWDMGLLALSAGACAVAAGFLTTGKDYSWLLSLHGLALAAFGAIIVFPLVKGPLSFRPVSLLFMVTAASIGVFALENARAQRRRTRGRLFLMAAGIASIGFAFSFVIVGFLIGRLEPPIFFSWMSSYFVLCAVFLLWVAFRVHSRGVRQSGQTGPFSPAPNET
jgi:MFS family permease